MCPPAVFIPYLYSVHVNFIKMGTHLVPWHIAFTQTTPPFETIVVGLCTKNLSMLYEDHVYNSRFADSFPRPADMKLDHVYPREVMMKNLKNLYLQTFYVPDIQQAILGTADCETASYMRDVVTNENQLVRTKHVSDCEDRALAAAYRHYKAAKAKGDAGSFTEFMIGPSDSLTPDL